MSANFDPIFGKPALGHGRVRVVDVTLSDATLKFLTAEDGNGSVNANMVTVVAGVPGYVILPTTATMVFDTRAGAWSNVYFGAQFAYKWFAGLAFDHVIAQSAISQTAPGGAYTTVGHKVWSAALTLTDLVDDVSRYIGQPLSLAFNNNGQQLTGGNANSAIHFALGYSLIKLL